MGINGYGNVNRYIFYKYFIENMNFYRKNKPINEITPMNINRNIIINIIILK